MYRPELPEISGYKAAFIILVKSFLTQQKTFPRNHQNCQRFRTHRRGELQEGHITLPGLNMHYDAQLERNAISDPAFLKASVDVISA